ncbi:peptide/nickel transport system substrate-binding protein [Thermocatellispora tengchongensis]|uniref:Peptide/nickel transport system substrate-binding protein n=1 Tax=Thermocatellispora tengchongensis TaxID=1073253 RepID=A0A840PCD4_9ACTN|nr:ABC transporter substrate-binding protein [Thermocatellispora tengchongensis]MBB5136902.1 peptide/nickel transport system substrate-binding protein [Thermocatellispora tengchongensis]
MTLRSTTPAAVRVLLAATLAVAATACTAGRNGSSGSSTSTLIVNTSFVYKTLDPGRAYEQTGYVALHAMYDSLLTFTGTDVEEPKPNLAESYTASDDAKTFTFTLRQGATFADGTPVTAEDVVFSLNRLQNLKGSSASFFSGLEATAKDARTVVITSEEPNPTVPVLMAMPASGILNRKLVTQHGATDGEDAATADKAQQYLDQAAAGSGPYVLERNTPGSEIVLKANDKYWGTKPAYSRVVIRNMDVQNQKLTMTRATDAEIALDLSGKFLDGLPETLSISQKQDTVYFAFLNTDPAVSKVSSNPKFAQAMRAAIDYPGLAALFGRGGGTARGLVAPAYPGALGEGEELKRDVEKAKRLLAEAGLNDPSVEFIYPAITYRGVDLGTVATKVQGDAAAAGIDIELTPLPLTAFLERYRGGKAPMGMTPQSLSYPRAESIVKVMSPGGVNAERMNWSKGYGAEEAGAAAKEFLAATTDAARNEAAVKWQRAMNTDSPYLLLASNSGTVVGSPAVTGAEYTPAGWTVDLAAVGVKK